MSRRILLVEDEVLIRLYVLDILKRLGCDVVGDVSSGEDAMAIALREKPDLVLMDIKLSGKMDGFEAAKMILEAYPARIVFMSAYDYEGQLDHADSDGRLAFISKPVDISSLKTLLDGIN